MLRKDALWMSKSWLCTMIPPCGRPPARRSKPLVIGSRGEYNLNGLRRFLRLEKKADDCMTTNPKNLPKTAPPPGDSFQLLFQNHPLPMWIYDLESLTFLEINDAAVEKYGYTRDEFLRMTIKDIRPEEDVKRLLADVKKERPSLQYSGAWRHRLKDGRIINVEITSHTLEFRGHKAALVTVYDITERQRASEALLLSRNQLEAVAQIGTMTSSTLDIGEVLSHILKGTLKATGASVGMIFLRHPETGCLEWGASCGLSEAFVEEYKNRVIKPGEGLTGLIAQTGEPIYIPEDSSHDPRIARPVVQAEGLNSFIGLPIYAENEIVAVMNILTRPPDVLPEEEIVLIKAIGTHVGFAIRNARLFKECKQTEEKLKESEASYRALAENLPGIVYRVNLNERGVMQFINPAVEMLTGYRADELVAGEICSIEPLILPEDRQEIIEIVNRAIEEVHPFEVEYRLRRKDAEIRYFFERGSVVRGMDDKPLYIDGFIFDITERKQAEEELRVQRDFATQVMNTLGEGLTVTDAEGRFKYVNPAYARMVGHSPESMIGRSPSDFTAPADWERLKSERHRRMKGEKSTYETRLLHADGHEVPVMITAVQRLHAGVFAGTIAVIADITERKQAEDNLRKSEEHFRTTLDNLEEGYYEVDLKGNFTLFNPAYARYLGYRKSEMMGMNYRQYMSPETAKDVFQVFNHCYRTGIPKRLYDIELICKDGARRFTEVSVSLIKIADEGIVGFRGIVRDISERKQTEEALRESEARNHAILDTLPDLMFVQSRDGTYLDYHAVDATALYVPPDQFLGAKMHDIFPKEFADTILGLFEQAIETGKMQIHEYQLPIAGQPRHFEARILSYGDEKILTIIREITERKRAEEEVRKLNAELEQRVEERTRELHKAQEQLIRQEKLAVLGQLAGGVGHELRNPLAVINNAVYFLKLIQPEADEKVKEYLGMIERETHTAEKIITDLLDFARIKSVDREPVSVSELVQRVLVRYPPPASVKMSLGFPKDLPKVQVDPRQMEQVLGNLVVNAFQAMPQGGKLAISAKKKRAEIALAVADTGVGIPAENMPKLFEPLFTTKLKGIGLGLAVCKKLAKANGGRIEVQSEPGKGSTFTLYLPTSYKEP